MLKVFIKYLYAGETKLRLSKLPKALKFTVSYYKDQKALKKKHRLRLIDLPYILRLQYKFDKANKSLIAQHIANQLYKEKSDQFQEFLTQKQQFFILPKKLSSEKQKLNELGIRKYLIDRTVESWKFCKENLKIDVISKFVVTYVNLYHKSLESLVDGHREVTRNHETLLSDGKTVKEKLEKFEERIKGETNFLKEKLPK